MPLTSFQETPQPVVPMRELSFRIGLPDVSEAARVADQAMYELGLAGPDRDENLAEITANFTALTKPGYDGRLHVLPRRSVPFAHIRASAEGKRPEDVQPFWVYPNLWTPGKEKNSYTNGQLDAGPANHVARLAVFSSVETGCDPVLHDLGMPYDGYKDEKIDVNPKGLPTQLDALAADQEAFAARHEGYTLDALDHRAFPVLALMDRIRGVKPTEPEDMILGRGVMRVPDLGRRTVDGDSVVGCVSSTVGRLYFGGVSGRADPGVGVGRSMGLPEA